jgi:hypothetical protein
MSKRWRVATGVPEMHLCLVMKIMSNLRKLTRKFRNPLLSTIVLPGTRVPLPESDIGPCESDPYVIRHTRSLSTIDRSMTYNVQRTYGNEKAYGMALYGICDMCVDCF